MAKTAMVLSPAELVCAAIAAGEKKAGLVWRKQVLLGILAGAFIAFASAASNMAAFHLLGRPESALPEPFSRWVSSWWLWPEESCSRAIHS